MTDSEDKLREAMWIIAVLRAEVLRAWEAGGLVTEDEALRRMVLLGNVRDFHEALKTPTKEA